MLYFVAKWEFGQISRCGMGRVSGGVSRKSEVVEGRTVSVWLSDLE